MPFWGGPPRELRVFSRTLPSALFTSNYQLSALSVHFSKPFCPSLNKSCWSKPLLTKRMGICISKALTEPRRLRDTPLYSGVLLESSSENRKALENTEKEWPFDKARESRQIQA